uniref:Uncharacterized protein n=1 Tax=Anguilla anguilla TaxID=7936 RepID=A0A0E9W4B9_ANGAN
MSLRQYGTCIDYGHSSISESCPSNSLFHYLTCLFRCLHYWVVYPLLWVTNPTTGH